MRYKSRMRRIPHSISTYAILSLGLLGCTLSDRFPFRTEVGDRSDAAYPPGVRVAAYLDGVYEEPREGVPSQVYELRIDVEQEDPSSPWRPDFSDAELRDDEGNRVPVSAWFTDASKSKPAGLERYRVLFEMHRPYRFASILAATVQWRMRAAGRPTQTIRSRFRR